MVQVTYQSDDERLRAAVARALEALAPGGTYVSLLTICDCVEAELGEPVSVHEVGGLREEILGRDEDAEYDRQKENDAEAEWLRDQYVGGAA